MNIVDIVKQHRRELYVSHASRPDTVFRHLVEMGGEIVNPGTRQHYAFLDRGSPILAVAHVDTVQKAWGKALQFHDHITYPAGKHWSTKERKYIKTKAYSVEKQVISHPNLDDRLGVFTIMHLLPSLGINLDILLTDYEESGQSTARFFETDKEYNWIVEFDRKGDDVVLYQYDKNEKGDDWQDAIKSAGFRKGWGTFSDIRELDFLDVCAMNIGVGYARYHSAKAYALLDQYADNIRKFVRFFQSNWGTRFPYEKKKYTHSTYTYPRATKNNWPHGNLSYDTETRQYTHSYGSPVKWDKEELMWRRDTGHPYIYWSYSLAHLGWLDINKKPKPPEPKSIVHVPKKPIVVQAKANSHTARIHAPKSEECALCGQVFSGLCPYTGVTFAGTRETVAKFDRLCGFCAEDMFAYYKFTLKTVMSDTGVARFFAVAYDEVDVEHMWDEAIDDIAAMYPEVIDHVASD